MRVKFLLNLCRHQRILWDLSDPIYKNRQERGECTSLNCQCLVGAAGWSHFVYIKYQSDQRQLCDVGLRQAGKAILRMAFSWGFSTNHFLFTSASDFHSISLITAHRAASLYTLVVIYHTWVHGIMPLCSCWNLYTHHSYYAVYLLLGLNVHNNLLQLIENGGGWVPMSYHLLTTLSPPEWLH